MQYGICFVVALLACILGKICGMGGGVIIKPVLDALGILSVSMINFLSGCTVLGMSGYSVGKSLYKRESEIDWGISTPLSVGAALGGFAGKEMFSRLALLFAEENMAGGIQAVLLLLATGATLFYTRNKDHIPMYHVKKPLTCGVIGLGLGTLGSFLGIGGGPFNMAVLYLFFSMTTKVAAQNSLYVILISQATGMIKLAWQGEIPSCPLFLLVGMVFCGIAGSEAGYGINRRLSDKAATRLLEASMVLVMAICLFNAVSFLGGVGGA